MVRATIGTIFLLFSTALFAQSLPSVDVDTANMQIEEFENENHSFESQISLLTESIARLNDEIETWTTWSSGIEKVSKLLEEQATRLFEVLRGIGSRSIVDRAQAVLQRYDRIAGLLTKKREELALRIAEAQDLVAGNTRTIELYRTRIKQNLKNIDLLKAAIAKSRSSESLIQSYLESLDSVLDNAVELLNKGEESDTK